MKRVLAILLAMTMLILMTACSKSTGGESSGSEGTKSGPTLPKYEITASTVKWLCWNSKSDLTDETTYLYEVNTMLKEHYNCELEIVRTTYDELPTKAASLVLGGNSPDLIFFRTQDYNTFIKQNIVQDVSSYIDFADPLWEDVKDVNDYFSYNGKNYLCVTSAINNSYIYYWKDVFTDAGLQTPLEMYKAGQWTLSDLRELAKNVTADTDRDGLVDMYGIAVHPDNAWLCGGTDFVTKDGKWQMNLRDPGLNTFFDFMYNTSSAVDNSRLMQYNVTADFTAKKAAMAWYEAWLLGTLGEQIKSGEIEFAPSPQADGADKYYVNGRAETAWVGANCANPGGAMAYLAVNRYLGTDEAQKARLREKNKTLYGYTDEMFELQEEMNSSKFEKTFTWQSTVGNWASDEGMWNLWSDVGLYETPWSNTVEKFAPILQANVDLANSGE